MFAIAVPAAGVAGVLIAVNATSTVASVAIPVGVFVGVAASRMLLARILTWARALMTGGAR